MSVINGVSSKTPQVESLAAPAPETVKAVNAWLAQHNITSQAVSPSGDMLRIAVDVDTANTLLNANYTSSIDPVTKSTVFTTNYYSIPAEMQPHIAFVYPTTKWVCLGPAIICQLISHHYLVRILPAVVSNPSVRIIQAPTLSSKARSKRADVPSSCAQTITPQCLQAIYNIPSTPATAVGNSIGVSGFANEVANQTDFQVSHRQVSELSRQINIPLSSNSSLLFALTSPMGLLACNPLTEVQTRVRAQSKL